MIIKQFSDQSSDSQSVQYRPPGGKGNLWKIQGAVRENEAHRGHENQSRIVCIGEWGAPRYGCHL